MSEIKQVYHPSLRERLAASAPPEPLWEFDVPMEKPRPKRVSVAEATQRVAVPGRGPDIKSRMDAQEIVSESLRSINAWENEQTRRRRTMWPWIWADAVIAAQALVDGAFARRNDNEQGGGI